MAIRYFEKKGSATAITNSTNAFWVILGFDANAALVSTGDAVTVMNQSGNTVDVVKLEAFGTAANELIVKSKKMLVPPSGTITFSHNAWFNGVSGSLEEVLQFI